MARRRNGRGSPASHYPDLREAVGGFLPHSGLPLLSGDGRVRWTSRLLTMVAIFMAWGVGRSLKDRFEQARDALVGIYPSRKRPGQTHEGLSKALLRHSTLLLGTLMDHWRNCLRQMAAEWWEVSGWALFGVDGTKFDCPRTEANEKGLGVSGKNNSGPQMLLTCLFHIGSGGAVGLEAWGHQGQQRAGPTDADAGLAAGQRPVAGGCGVYGL